MLLPPRSGDACPYVPGVRHIAWNIPDPQGAGLDTVCEIRDLLRAQVRSMQQGRAQQMVVCMVPVAHPAASNRYYPCFVPVALRPSRTWAVLALAIPQGAIRQHSSEVSSVFYVASL